MRKRSLTQNLALSLSYSMVSAYCVMSVFWIFTGMKYTALKCLEVYSYAFYLFILLLCGISLMTFFEKKNSLKEMKSHIYEYGYDNGFYNMLVEFLSCGKGFDSLNDSERILFASYCLDGKRYEHCREILSKLDFSDFCEEDREEIVNMYFYSTLLEENLPLADKIFTNAEPYLMSAVSRRGNGHIIHTLGCYAMLREHYTEAEQMFTIAKRSRKKSLRCECELSIGLCRLKKGDTQGAKESCVQAAKLAKSSAQYVRLKGLMSRVENSENSKLK